MTTKIIGDPGSCHMGRLEYAKELVRVGAGAGLNAVKFQLLTSAETKNGNIAMDWEWLPELMDLGDRLGVEVFASVFDRSGWDWLIKCGCKSVKLSYSQANKLSVYPHVSPLVNYFVSEDVMSPPNKLTPVLLKNPDEDSLEAKENRKAMRIIRLYCIPEYPVRYMVDFEGLFPRFDGFSSHCLGIEQDLRAVEAGAKYLEVHYTLDKEDISCPDHRFAKHPFRLEQLCNGITGKTTPHQPPRMVLL